ncbi:hypothetical protein Pfo_023028 [Paulownia fortunei]|nr:hypothetical protein Pfo_023028 [Paulownia fortunei]
MVDDQDQEDVKSFPTLYKQKSDVFEPVLEEGKLWVELEIPRDEEGGLNSEDQIICFKEKDQMNDCSKNIERVCHVCHKGFSSGKALGGHMRIHVHKAKNKVLVFKKSLKAHQTIKFKKQNPRDGREIDFVKKKEQYGGSGNTIKKPTCIICDKDFPSMKSLFGHMRCHPERDWRGIHPPSTVKNSSFSSLSDAEPRKIADKDQIEVLANEAVDLAESLRGWPVTARRGRKALTAESTSECSSSEEHQLCKAVDYLMMLARGSPFGNGLSHTLKVDTSEATNSNLPVCKAKVLEFKSGSKSNKPKIDQSLAKFRTHSPVEQLGNEMRTSNDVEKTVLERGLVLRESVNKLEGRDQLEEREHNYFLDYNQLDSKNMEQLDDTDFESANLKVLIKSRKKRKKVNICDLELAQEFSPVTPVQDKMVAITATTPPPDKYRCNTCGKSFPTHQALGGHRSSHKRFKIVIHDSIGKYGHLSSPTAHVEEEIDKGGMSLNLVEVIQHQCMVCNKNFPTAQDLVGHKMCHGSGSMEAPASQVMSPGEASRTSWRALDLDLNELPPSEDEACFKSELAVGNYDYASFSTNCDSCL